MNFVFEIAVDMVVQAIAAIFGETVASERPKWVRFLAEVGCGMILLAFVLIVFLIAQAL